MWLWRCRAGQFHMQSSPCKTLLQLRKVQRLERIYITCHKTSLNVSLGSPSSWCVCVCVPKASCWLQAHTVLCTLMNRITTDTHTFHLLPLSLIMEFPWVWVFLLVYVCMCVVAYALTLLYRWSRRVIGCGWEQRLARQHFRRRP